MRNGFRQSMAWLHTWSGLVVGWVLFAVFVTGTASYYRSEISQWMRPELQSRAALGPEEMAAATERGIAYLQEHAAGARGWFITPPRPDMPVTQLFWRMGPVQPSNYVLLDPETGKPATVRDTKGGEFFYRFHFELHMPPLWGRWIVGICAMFMLVALVSGVITHRRIFADFFTFRRSARSAQRAWLDAHNVTGVLALPYHLMITYTGVVTLAMMYVPWGVTTAYQGNAQRFYAETGQITTPRPPVGKPGTLAPIGPMVLQATRTISEPLERISVINPGDAQATVIAVFEEPPGLSHEHPQIAFDGTTGTIVEVRQGGLQPASKTFTTMVGLHEAHFAGPALRVLFFLCGLAGCAMVATGLLLWSVARLPKPGVNPSFGLRLVQGLNVATVAGLPAATAVFLLANRLLPVGVPGRADWEIRAFFASWILTGVIACLRPQRRAWSEMLALAAALFAAACGTDIVRLVGAHYGTGTMPDPVFLGVDAALLGLAALLLFAGRKAAGSDGSGGRRTAQAVRTPPQARDRLALQEAGE